MYLSQYRQLAGTGPLWVRPLRESAVAAFSRQGFPSRRLEEWKYTSVERIAKISFKRPDGGVSARVSQGEVRGFLFGTGTELVFVNGRYRDELSSVGSLPSGVRAMSLARAMESEQELVERHLARYVDCERHGFAALNTAFVEDGAFLYLPADYAATAPFHFLFVSTPSDGGAVCHPRNLIVAEEGSRAAVVETYVGSAGDVYFTNAITEIAVGAGADVSHCKVQRESEAAFHVATVEAHQERDSRFASCSVSIGGALVRNDINAVLDAEGSTCALDGLYLARGRQHVDHHTCIDHRKAHCSSNEIYKGVLDGRARGVFNGKVFVRPDAQKTDTHQINRNLLLSGDAAVDTKPQLEIFADDVHCTHGATIGCLDEEALFYLRSRGIGAAEARTILIHAFANEIVERIESDATVRAPLERLLYSRFGSNSPREARL